MFLDETNGVCGRCVFTDGIATELGLMFVTSWLNDWLGTTHDMALPAEWSAAAYLIARRGGSEFKAYADTAWTARGFRAEPALPQWADPDQTWLWLPSAAKRPVVLAGLPEVGASAGTVLNHLRESGFVDELRAVLNAQQPAGPHDTHDTHDTADTHGAYDAYVDCALVYAVEWLVTATETGREEIPGDSFRGLPALHGQVRAGWSDKTAARFIADTAEAAFALLLPGGTTASSTENRARPELTLLLTEAVEMRCSAPQEFVPYSVRKYLMDESDFDLPMDCWPLPAAEREAVAAVARKGAMVLAAKNLAEQTAGYAPGIHDNERVTPEYDDVIYRYFPPRYRHHYTAGFAHRMSLMFSMILAKFAEDAWKVPSCVAEEMCLAAVTAEAAVLCRTAGVAHDDSWMETATEDADYEFLFMPALDGIENDPPSAMGVVNLQWGEWFDSFQGDTVPNLGDDIPAAAVRDLHDPAALTAAQDGALRKSGTINPKQIAALAATGLLGRATRAEENWFDGQYWVIVGALHAAVASTFTEQDGAWTVDFAALRAAINLDVPVVVHDPSDGDWGDEDTNGPCTVVTLRLMEKREDFSSELMTAVIASMENTARLMGHGVAVGALAVTGLVLFPSLPGTPQVAAALLAASPSDIGVGSAAIKAAQNGRYCELTERDADTLALWLRHTVN